MIPQTQTIERSVATVPEIEARSSRQPKASSALLALQTYQDLRDRGLSDIEIMAFAGEVLELVAQGVSGHGQDDVYLDV